MKVLLVLGMSWIVGGSYCEAMVADRYNCEIIFKSANAKYPDFNTTMTLVGLREKDNQSGGPVQGFAYSTTESISAVTQIQQEPYILKLVGQFRIKVQHAVSQEPCSGSVQAVQRACSEITVVTNNQIKSFGNCEIPDHPIFWKAVEIRDGIPVLDSRLIEPVDVTIDGGSYHLGCEYIQTIQ